MTRFASGSTSDPAAAPAESSPRIGARGPGSTPEALRDAYLDLLKLALVDLVGTTTTSVQGLAHGRLSSRELAGEELELRAVGRDWPLHGLTMTGLRRLDDLQRCVETIAAEQIPGDLIEAGTWRGGSALLMRAALDCHGEHQRTVWVADSFQGFPAPDPARVPEPTYADSLAPYFAAFDFLSVPESEVQASFRRLGLSEGVRFVPGFFETTLPELPARPWSLIRLDSDAYETTRLALRCLYPGLSVGGYAVIDDYGALEECRAAVDDFRREHGITEPLETVDWTCVRWRREDENEIPAFEVPRPGGAAPAPMERPSQRPRIPAGEELALEQELAELRDRLQASEAELTRVRGELEGRLREMTQSVSWRVTEPLRRLKSWQRRPPRT